MNATNIGARRRVARLEDIGDGSVTAVDLGDRELALYRIGSQVYATDILCTHGGGRLCDGFLEGFSIECPLHQGTFDVRTGAATRAPAEEPVATYRVEIEDGTVYIVVPSSSR